MPEGPSLVIIREQVEVLNLVGSQIKVVTGTTTIDKKRMAGQKVLAFKNWGKHFLICFDGFALRIHLMMFGSYRINEHKYAEPKISFQFENAVLSFYTCSLEFIEGDLREIYDWHGDIMSDEWSNKKAIKKLKLAPEVAICDALLNQEIFSGSGNIIKNEVLYRTKINPKSKIGEITPAKLKELVVNTREYAFDFLKWKRDLVFSKNWLIYSKKICPKQHVVTKQNLGKNKRVTYYCETCQMLY